MIHVPLFPAHLCQGNNPKRDAKAQTPESGITNLHTSYGGCVGGETFAAREYSRARKLNISFEALTCILSGIFKYGAGDEGEDFCERNVECEDEDQGAVICRMDKGDGSWKLVLDGKHRKHWKHRICTREQRRRKIACKP
jgi:hypothetical protein